MLDSYRIGGCFGIRRLVFSGGDSARRPQYAGRTAAFDWGYYGVTQSRGGSPARRCRMGDVFTLSVPVWNLALRCAVIYCALLMGLRLTGKREVGQFTLFDL